MFFSLRDHYQPSRPQVTTPFLASARPVHLHSLYTARQRQQSTPRTHMQQNMSKAHNSAPSPLNKSCTVSIPTHPSYSSPALAPSQHLRALPHVQTFAYKLNLFTATANKVERQDGLKIKSYQILPALKTGNTKFASAHNKGPPHNPRGVHNGASSGRGSKLRISGSDSDLSRISEQF